MNETPDPVSTHRWMSLVTKFLSIRDPIRRYRIEVRESL
jgi:hypothetical protein